MAGDTHLFLYSELSYIALTTNPSLHHIASLDVVPCLPADRDNQFNLELHYKPEGKGHEYRNVYVPPSVQHALLFGKIKALHIETVELNSMTARCFDRQPNYLVCGIYTSDDEIHEAIPDEIRKTYVSLMSAGVVLGIGGLCALGFLNPFLGALMLVGGTHSITAAQRMPRKPLRWLTTYKPRSSL